MSANTAISLAAEDATASLATRGAELLSWRVGGRELIWHGDPAHWPWHAPILFPIVGEASGGAIRVEGRAYPIARHGFARNMEFTLIERDEARAHLRLTDSDETRARYPYPFRLDVVVTLAAASLSLVFEVSNTGDRDLPYAVGFHPAFLWPFDGDSREDHAVVFAAEEDPVVPEITSAGSLRPKARRLPLEGRRLPLDPALFAQDALVFLDARSPSLRFTAPTGAAIGLEADEFVHLALWTKPTAPFLSMEAWTGHADPEGFSGELADKPSMRLLGPGARAQHAVTLRWHAPDGRGGAV